MSKEVYDAYEANDARRDLSILNIDKRIKDMWEKGVTVSYGGRYQNTGYFLNKYLPRPGGTEGQMGDADLNWDYNLHLYRYAETLLNAAELAMETGNNTDAQKYLDEVRQRAGVASVAVNLDNILNERRLEFVGEGKRYFDLVRTGKAATVLKAGAGVVLLQKGNEIKEGKLVEGTPVWGGTAIPERQAWNPNKKYIQIPQGEIEVTASKGEEFAIKQNPQ